MWPSCMRTSRLSQVPPQGLGENRPGAFFGLTQASGGWASAVTLKASPSLACSALENSVGAPAACSASGRSSSRTLPLLATFR